MYTSAEHACPRPQPADILWGLRGVQAQEVNAQLRKELSAEHTRRKAAMDALLGTGPE